jgi:hypothetical protein
MVAEVLAEAHVVQANVAQTPVALAVLPIAHAHSHVHSLVLPHVNHLCLADNLMYARQHLAPQDVMDIVLCAHHVLHVAASHAPHNVRIHAHQSVLHVVRQPAHHAANNKRNLCR